MRLTLLKAKLHAARVTRCDLHYEGSVSVDTALMDAAGLLPNERVEIWNITNGQRISTYVIPGAVGEIAINGAGARLFETGDSVIVAAFADMEVEEAAMHEPVILVLDGDNRPRVGACDHPSGGP